MAVIDTNLSDPIVIVGAARTPMGGFQGVLRDVPAPQLGATAIGARPFGCRYRGGAGHGPRRAR